VKWRHVLALLLGAKLSPAPFRSRRACRDPDLPVYQRRVAHPRLSASQVNKKKVSGTIFCIERIVMLPALPSNEEWYP